MVERKLDYYDVIRGLASLDRSHQVSFNKGELRELVKNRIENMEPAVTDLYRNNKNRINIHGYLGGKVDMKQITEMTYDLDHNLLGGFVPRQQLETLSSADFARYFHKKIECGNSLRTYDTFLSDVHFGLMAKPKKIEMNETAENKDTAENKETKPVTTPTSAHIRKVVVCKRCNSRFVGPSRMKSLRRHNCKR